MPQEYNLVVADTSCFILLDKINELNLLKEVFSSITTTPEIAKEFGKPLPEWILIKQVLNSTFMETLQTEVDKGEAEAIVLAVEIHADLLLMDDLKGRKFGRKEWIENSRVARCSY